MVIIIGAVRYPGIKIHDVRVIRLLEVLLHGGTHVGGRTAKEIYQAVLATCHSLRLSERAYGLNQLRYEVRKLKGHGLIERDGSRYASLQRHPGGAVVLFFHKRLVRTARSPTVLLPSPRSATPAREPPRSRLHRADQAIEHIVDLLAAA
jgi:hypothetical protein